MKIRYANKKDEEWIKNELLNDNEGRSKLNIKGSTEGNIIKTDDDWSASFVAEDRKKQIGVITVSYRPSQNSAYINDIYIKKKHRKNGVGKRLLEFAIEYAISNWSGTGIYAFTLENEAMDKLLPRVGFKNHGTYEKFIQIGNDWIKQTYWRKEYET